MPVNTRVIVQLIWALSADHITVARNYVVMCTILQTSCILHNHKPLSLCLQGSCKAEKRKKLKDGGVVPGGNLIPNTRATLGC